jgi:chorismate-pyruvate lyase
MFSVQKLAKVPALVRKTLQRIAAPIAACCLVTTMASADAAWPDTPLARAETLALLQTLNATLLSHDSATLTLDDWCSRHRLATPATIVAERVRNEDKPADTEVRALLNVDAATAVAYRRVRLRCGARVLSEADNWYVPTRLTAEMNNALNTSDIAFGRAVKALRFSRHTLSAQLLWSPLPEGWDSGGTAIPTAVPGGSLAIPAHVLEHRAVLTLPDGTPFSTVVESYTAAVLDFPPPGAEQQ